MKKLDPAISHKILWYGDESWYAVGGLYGEDASYFFHRIRIVVDMVTAIAKKKEKLSESCDKP